MMATDNSGNPLPLAELRVLVTRPASQAAAFCQMVEVAGGEAVLQPTIEIVASGDSTSLLALEGAAATLDLAIFVSANAARIAGPSVVAARQSCAHVRIGAVGEKTAGALRALGLAVDLVPASPYNSEAFLALPELANVRGWHVALVRGGEGRDLLAATLRARGALVSVADVYARRRPDSLDPAVTQRIAEGSLDVLTATSAEGLANLVAMTPEPTRERLLALGVVAGAPRIGETARGLGFKMPPIVVANPSDESMFEGLCDWARNLRSR